MTRAGESGPFARRTQTVNFNPASVAANISAEQAVTVPGVAVGDQVFVNPATAPTAGLLLGPTCRVSAADTVQMTCANLTAAPIDQAALDLVFTIFKRQIVP